LRGKGNRTRRKVQGEEGEKRRGTAGHGLNAGVVQYERKIWASQGREAKTGRGERERRYLRLWRDPAGGGRVQKRREKKESLITSLFLQEGAMGLLEKKMDLKAGPKGVTKGGGKRSKKSISG